MDENIPQFREWLRVSDTVEVIDWWLEYRGEVWCGRSINGGERVWMLTPYRQFPFL